MERRAADRESTSASVTLGKNLSRLQWDRNGKGLFSESNLRNLTGKYQRSEDFAVADGVSERILSQFGPNATYESMSNDGRQNLSKITREAVQSGDTNRMIGAYLANARLGNYMNDDEQEAILSALQKQDVDRGMITARYKEITKQKHGYNIASPTANGDSEAEKAAYLNYLQDEIGSVGDTKLQNDIAQNMINKLMVPGTSNLRSIEEIEGNTTLFGIANTLLQERNYSRLTPGQRDRIALLDTTYRKELGVAKTAEILDPAKKSSVVLKTQHFDHIAPLFSPGKITPQNWASLTDKQREAIIGSLTPKRRVGLKNELQTHATNTIGKIPKPTWADDAQRVNVLKLIQDAIDTSNPTNSTKPISIDDLKKAIDLDGNFDDRDKKLLTLLQSKLRSVNAALGNIQKFDDLKSKGTI
jgi:predicted Fe-S protein YdhL (DUF1289 family)